MTASWLPTHPPAPSRPARTALVALLALVLACAVLPFGVPAARAADASQFRAGSIISDAVFYDSTAMSRDEIASFLTWMGQSCRPGSTGTPCLKDFRQDTWTRTASGCAGTYEGRPSESAADIIAKVSVACGINPRVLLVLLQKEQSLVTASGAGLTPRRYQIATGYGCPDTAPCEAQYYGFYNQVFLAARQFQLYTQNPTRYTYRADRANTIQFHPNASCGSSSVTIQNSATAALYNYTPYQPNAAVLRGAPDGCSSYGNLNFWSMFTDWFGTTQWRYAVTGTFGELWARIGYSGSLLGVPTSPQVALREGGTYQNFSGGAIYSSPATGTHWVTTAFTRPWSAAGWETGTLGYPVSDPVFGLLPSNGVYQNFAGGVIYSSPATGAHYVTNAFVPAWSALGWERGALGYPTSDPVSGLLGGGSYQNFSGGAIYSSPATGTFGVTTAVAQAWGSTGWERGPLGYPTSAATTDASGTVTQQFRGGVVSVPRPGGTAYAMTTAVRTLWESLGGTSGVLGAPTSGTVTGLRDGGSYQNFAGGAVHASASTGAHATVGSFYATWSAAGWEGGPFLGYPTAEAVADPATGAISQTFQGGTITATSASATPQSMSTGIRAAWDRAGGASGQLGRPTSGTVTGLRDQGSFQNFTGGAVHASRSTGAHWTSGTVYVLWSSTGWEGGRLGYPTSDPVDGLRGGGTYQNFAGGAIYASPASGTHSSDTVLMQAWARVGWENGILGYPTSEPVSGLRDGGRYQNFVGGSIHYSPATGAHATSGAVRAAWAAAGWETGPYGYPVGDAVTSGGTVSQQFQSGTITVPAS
ncbi:LGFP repeat-containing protein [Cellulomonas endometrii]|uniref:LGFP repeat-containing protein n=1 Tax=Cellulomonas endometrii TaxID=3036301 RepID=UPI0024AE2391|nr:hypothetical protein [Cellulomonas endometrii]